MCCFKLVGWFGTSGAILCPTCLGLMCVLSNIKMCIFSFSLSNANLLAKALHRAGLFEAGLFKQYTDCHIATSVSVVLFCVDSNATCCYSCRDETALAELPVSDQSAYQPSTACIPSHSSSVQPPFILVRKSFTRVPHMCNSFQRVSCLC